MFNFFCKILQHPKINPGSAPVNDRNIGLTSGFNIARFNFINFFKVRIDSMF